MADNKVSIEIQVDAKDAEKVLDQFGASATKSIKKVEDSSKGLGKSFASFSTSAAASLATVGISLATIKKGIEEAISADKGVRQLSLSLAATGEYSKAAADGLLQYAEALSEVTGIDNDAIVGSLTLAKTFGITNDKAKELVDAAADLAAVTGDDLTTATRLLGGTLDGTIGKVGNLGPAFRNLTAEQLKNGDAIKLIKQQYGDAAEILGGGFEANISRVTNAFNDAFKEIGKVILDDKSIVYGLKLTAQLLKDLAPVVGFITKVFVNGFKTITLGLSEFASNILKVFSAIAKSNPLAFGGLKSGIDDLQGYFDGLSNNIIDSFSASSEGANKFEQSLEKVNAASQKTVGITGKMREEIDKFINQITSEFASASEKEAQKLTEVLVKLAGYEQKGLIDTQKAYEIRSKIVNDFYDKRAKDDEEAYQKQLDIAKKYSDDLQRQMQDARQKIESLAANPIKILVEGEINTEKVGASIAGIIDQSLSGKEGAKSAVSGLGSLIGDAILPGLGGVFGSIFGKLTAGPEQAKAMVKEFTDALPDMLIALAEALPEVIATLVQKVFTAEFIGRLAFGFGKAMLNVFTAGLFSFAPKWGEEIGKALREPFDKFARTLGSIFQPILDAFKGVRDAFDPIISSLDSLRNSINDLIGPIKDLIGSLGGGDGKSNGNILTNGTLDPTTYFSGGGVVYAANGFQARGTDTIPAMLTPGEMVIPRDMVGQLGAYLEQGGSSEQMAMMTAILAEVSKPVTVYTEAKVNQNAFADIILQLSRQNARLRA